MPNNNPRGLNGEPSNDSFASFRGFPDETPGKVPGLNLPFPGRALPRRAQRAASRPRTALTPTPPPAVPAPAVSPEPMNPNLELAQTWQAIAEIPGASDLVKAYASRAQQFR